MKFINSSKILKLNFGKLKQFRRKIFFGLLMTIIMVSSYQIWGFINPSETEAAWYDSGWGFRRKFVVNSSEVSGTHTNFPILVSITDINLKDKTQSDGGDILFTSIDGTTKLDHEIESFSQTAGTLVAWVEIPSLTTTTEFFMYFGNAGSSDQENASGTWNSNFKLVSHLNQDPTPTSSSECTVTTKEECDSTTVNDGDSGGSMNSSDLITGQILNGLDFDGSDDYVDFGANSSLDIGTSDFSVLAWLDIDDINDNRIVLGKSDGSPPASGRIGFQFRQRSDLGSGRMEFLINDGDASGITMTGTGDWDNAGWNHIALSADRDGNAVMYRNSSSDGSTSISSASSSINVAQSFVIGGNSHDVPPGNNIDGRVDEVWVMVGTAVSSDFVTTAYNNQSDPASFFSDISDIEYKSEPAGYWRFDEAVDNTCTGGANDACDSMPSQNDGAKTGALWQPPEMCVQGNCLYFDGSDDVVTVLNEDQIDFDVGLNDGVTVSFWIRPITDGENSTGEIFEKGSRFYCRTDTEGGGFADLECSIDLVTTDATVNITDGLTLGRWHHVEATYADDGDDDLLVYIDGQLRGTGNGSGAPASTDSNNLLIGGDSLNNYHGFIDEFKIYAYERTAAEVKTDYIVGAGEAGSGASVANDNFKYLSDGLVGYWDIEEASGTRADRSGFGNSLTDTGTVPSVVGKFGSSGNFTNSNEMLNRTDASQTALDLTTNFTLSAWVNPTSVGTGWKSILSKALDKDAGDDSLGTNCGLYQNGPSLYPRFDISSTGTTWDNGLTGANTVATGSWTHLTCTFDGSTMKLYLNGSLQSSASYSGTAYDNAGDFALGGMDYTGGGGVVNDFDGKVDDARVYNRVLAANEINTLYNWGPSPTLYYPLDENYSSVSPYTIYDRSVNGNNGTTAGTMTSDDWINGKFGTALDFDGTDDVVDANDVALTDVGDGRNFSVSFWMNRSTFTTDDTVIAKKNDQLNSSAGWVIWVDDTNDDVRLVVSDGDSANLHTVDSTSSFTTTGWNHVTVVYDDSSSTASKIYINGVDDGATNTTSGTFTSIGDLTNAVDFRVGSESDGGVPFAGTLDDVKFYNYARSASQVLEDMNGFHPVGGSPIGSPVAHWKFDDLNGTTAQDSSINNNDLTLNSASWTQSGKFSGAWNGTGGNLRLSRTTDSDLEFGASDSFAISAWFKSDSASNPGAIEYILANGGPAGSAGYALYVNTSGYPCFGIDDDTSWGPDVGSCSAIDYYDNSWHQVTGVRDVATDKIYLYVDGVLLDSDTDTTTATLDASTTFYIGDIDTDDAGTGEEFAGDLDEIKVYRAALTSDQVRMDYNAGSAINFGSGTNERLLVEPSPTPVDYANNLIGYWPLDENTGTTTSYDKSVSAYDLTLTSVAEGDWSPGKYGSAIDFDGTNDYATAASENGNYSINSYTVSAWIYRQTDSGGIEAIVDNRDADNDGWTLFVNASDKFSCSYNSTDSASATSISLNTWYHVSCTSNGSTQTLYLNGILEDSDATSGSISETTDVRIATQSYGTSQKFSGLIDEVRVFSSALSQAQISYESNRGGPVGWWKFDECTGDTLNNATGLSAYNGTRSGTGALNTSSGSCTSGNASHAWRNGASGRFGASLDFDADDDGTGGDDVVTISLGSVIDFNEGLQNGVTFSAWIYANSDGEANTGNIINKGTNTYCRVDNQVSTSLDLECQLDLTSTDRNVNISGAITTNTWTHVAMSWSNDADDDISVWVNGILRSSSTTNTNDTIPADTNNFYIGNNSSGSLTFDGKIDDIRIYNYELSAGQMRQVYTGGAVRFE